MKLTFKQVAEKAGVNPSTAAFQRNKFEEFIPSVGEGRHRRYNDESVEVIKITSTMYSKGKSYEEIKDFLENRFGIPTSSDLVVQELPQLDIIEGIREMLSSELAKRDESVERMLSKRDEAIGKLSQQVESLSQGSEERDRLLMENIRLLQEKKKGWRFWR